MYDSGSPGLAVGKFHDLSEDAMSSPTLFDRLNHELEAFGKKAQAALDEGKLQIELMRARRRRDNAARDLGLLVYRRERGGEVEPRRIDALFLRLDDLVADVTRLEGLVDARRKSEPAASPVTSPAAN
jgi:outer membrane murein-binding lipoprotein Lpp